MPIAQVLRHESRCSLDWLFRRSPDDQDYTGCDKYSRADEFSACDQISEGLPRHKRGVGEARPCCESNQATIRRWVAGCQQQENAECHINAEHHRQGRLLLHKQHQGIS